jgi:hypothetical protein
MIQQASIWHRDETPGYDKGKKDLGFTRWRVLVMERTSQLAEITETEAVQRLHQYGLHDLGLDYEAGRTAEDVSTQLSRNRAS